MDSLAGRIRSVIAQEPETDPNDDPQELYRQVLPLLQQMGLQNMVQRGKTRIITDQVQGNLRLYCITLRRDAKLTGDQIARLNRNVKKFSYIEWNQEAIQVYVWNPYETAVTAPAAMPAAPVRT
jgi:hypothetical protein